MGDIIIINIESGAEGRKQLKKLLPVSMQKSLNDAGVDVEMESGEQLRDKLPEGFSRAFVVPEEVLVFPTAEKEPEERASMRKRLKAMSLKNRRKKQPGNTE